MLLAALIGLFVGLEVQILGILNCSSQVFSQASLLNQAYSQDTELRRGLIELPSYTGGWSSDGANHRQVKSRRTASQIGQRALVEVGKGAVAAGHFCEGVDLSI